MKGKDILRTAVPVCLLLGLLIFICLDLMQRPPFRGFDSEESNTWHDAAVPSATTGQLTPKIDLSGETRPMADLWMIAPAYEDAQGFHAPLTCITDPDGTAKEVHHFDDWKEEFRLDCFPMATTFLFGQHVTAYRGWTWSLTRCGGEYYVATNAADKVYRIRADGTREVVTDRLPDPGVPSQIECFGDSFLLVTMLPGPSMVPSAVIPVHGIQLAKVEFDGRTSVIAELPSHTDFSGQLAGCPYPQTILAALNGLSAPMRVNSAQSVLVADLNTGDAYTVYLDGAILKEPYVYKTAEYLYVLDPLRSSIFRIDIDIK